VDDGEEVQRGFWNERGSNRCLSCEDCMRQAGFEKLSRTPLDIGNKEACCAAQSLGASVAPYRKHTFDLCSLEVEAFARES
jgi:hypothetical protein